MRRFSFSLFVLLTLILFAPSARAQSCPNPTVGDCSIAPDTGYSFGDAKNHDHGDSYYFQTITAYYCGHGLVEDSSNTTGNQFFGNTICVRDMNGDHWFWYDWGADSLAGQKLSTWRTDCQPFCQWVSVTYDPVCGLAFSATNPYSTTGNGV